MSSFSKEDMQTANQQTPRCLLNIIRHWEMDGSDGDGDGDDDTRESNRC